MILFAPGARFLVPQGDFTEKARLFLLTLIVNVFTLRYIVNTCSMKISLSLIAIINLITVITPSSISMAQDREANNPVLKLDTLHEENEKWVIVSTKPITIYRSPGAQKIRAVLFQDQEIDVLEMNRFGLHIRGRAKNGLINGWAGWKQVVGDDVEKLKMLEFIRKRQLKIMPLLEKKTPAIGMTLIELKRVLGSPTSIQTKVVEGKKTQTLQWVRKKMVDADDVLGQLAVFSRAREIEVEAGSITAVLVNGVAHTVVMDLNDGSDDVAVVNPPGKVPFEAVINTSVKKTR